MAATDTEKSTIIFDGDCSFCRQRIAEIKRLDSKQAFDYLARQAPESEQQFPQIKNIPLDDGILFIAADGQVHVAADAMYQIALKLPATSWFAPLYQLPGIKQISRLGYRLVAANRKRLGRVCHDGACHISK